MTYRLPGEAPGFFCAAFAALFGFGPRLECD
jgi:hypothetical protein